MSKNQLKSDIDSMIRLSSLIVFFKAYLYNLNYKVKMNDLQLNHFNKITNYVSSLELQLCNLKTKYQMN